jgi:hypothetical protein
VLIRVGFGFLAHATLLDMPEPRDVPDEAPPFLGTWKRVYIAITIYLAALITVFYLFTRHYR